MKILIRYLGMTIERVELSPGEYVLGRSQDCDIVLTQEFISRRHAKIWHEDGRWFYQDLRDGHPDYTGEKIVLDQTSLVELGHDVDLVTEDYLEHADTQVTNVHNIKQIIGQSKTNRKVILALSLALLILVASGGGYFAYQRLTRPMDPNTLLTFVRSKIVEFEKIKDEEAIEDYKKYGQLKDEDFKETSGFCTGFIIAPNVVLTAAHCMFGQLIIDMNTSFKLKTSDDKRHVATKILGFDIKKDFLFLEVPGLDKYGYLNISDKYKVGQKVFTVGNVHGEGIAIRDGIMASKTADPNDPEIKFVRYSAAASPGNSGGPLVDEYGNVVALVFAGTWTENYNLGSSAEYLLEGKSRFVSNKSNKPVKIEFRKLLNYSPRWLLERLSFPHNSNFDENPETLRAMENVQVEVDVPTEIEPFADVVLNRINEVVRIKFQQITKSLDDQGMVSLGWNSFVTEETPIIIPSQFDKSQIFFKRIAPNQLVPRQAAILDTPAPKDFLSYKKKLDEQKKFDFQAYGYMMDIVEDPQGDFSEKDILYAMGPFDTKKRIWSYMFGVPYAQLKFHSSSSEWEKVRSLSYEMFLKNFVGKKGVIANSFSQLVRPKSSREFTINAFDEEVSTEQIVDPHKRVWSRHSFSMFDRLTIDIYCIQLPQGALCLTKMFPTKEETLLKISRENYVRYWLPNYLINPYFYTPESLIDFQDRKEKEGLSFMKGFKITRTNTGGLNYKLEKFGLEFRFPKSKVPVSIRPTTGILGDDNNQDWVSLGMEGLFKLGKEEWEICGVGVEIDGTFSNYMLNLYREGQKKKKQTLIRKKAAEKKNNKKSKGSKKEDENDYPEVFMKSHNSKLAGRQTKVFGYCVPVEKDALIEDVFAANLNKAKPFEVEYR